MQVHEFALYYSEIFSGDFILTDKQFIHRLHNVLRLKVKDQLVLFNCHEHACATIQEMSTKKICIHVGSVKKNESYKPHMQVALALLKREALERALEELTAVGVNEIVLYVSSKVQRKWGGSKELARLQRIIIAAAEQSKNFAFPMLKEPIQFDQIIKKDGTNIWCDLGGQSLVKFICSQKLTQPIQVVIGPEGDLADEEKNILKKNNYTVCQLTPTVLRAHQAASLAAGIIRSMF